MHTPSPLRSGALVTIAALLLLLVPFTVPHSTAQEPTGTVTIQQITPHGIYGEWTLIKPGNKKLMLSKEKFTLENAPIGNYTLIAVPPAGTSTVTRTYIDTDLLTEKNAPQTSFSIEPGMNIKIVLEYTLTRTGKIAISSEPPGITYDMIGPNNIKKSGVSPGSYENMPIGLYSLTFQAIPGCASPRPLSDQLIKDGRINFTMKYVCSNGGLPQEQEYQRTIEYVNVTVDGRTVLFTDTPVREWFAPYVHIAIKTGIMSGYRDSAGQPTGQFGPGDSMTLAQLAKIAHELSNISEENAKNTPKNPQARGEWYERYIASAESLDWLVFADPDLDLNRPATRAEVVVTLLQALDVRRFWPTGALFNDVPRTLLYADSIETATVDGLVSGFTDSDGNPTGEFGPNRPINRAEMATIISNAIEVYTE